MRRSWRRSSGDPVKAEARSRLIVFREAGLSKEDALALVEEVYGG